VAQFLKYDKKNISFFETVKKTNLKNQRLVLIFYEVHNSYPSH